ncbi:MAG: hypothetical protein QG588_590 [Candidatus Poribacteria bacterium]|nr:hypothetical protein [Candidatus Poribacteria bacterium]
MKCSKYKKFFVEFTDGRLDYHKNQEIQDHIMICKTCREEVEKLRSSMELVSFDNILSNETKPPDNFPENVLDRIYSENTNSKLSFNFAMGIVVMICLIGLGLEISLFHRSSSDQEILTYTTNIQSIKTALPKIVATSQPNYVKPISMEIKEKSVSNKNVQLSSIQHNNKNDLQQANVHISMEILKLLGPTLEVIEGDKQEWEIEI